MTADALTNVLFIAYYYPPVGGAGVQRSVKFARYLGAEGFHPIIVTGDGPSDGRWEPRDDTLAEEVKHLPVFRPKQPPPPPGAGSRLARRLGRKSPFTKWWQQAIMERGRDAAIEHRPSLIYVSLSPYESLEPALELGASLGLPVVADLRDPWALDEVRIYPTRWHRRRELRTMRQLFARCARVIMNTPAAAETARRAFPDLPPDRIDSITNGFDTSDFADLKAPEWDGKFRILHTGYLHTAMGHEHRSRGLCKRMLGGELVPVDFLSRSHMYLIAALERLEAEKPGRTDNVELVLAGVLSDADRSVIRTSEVASLVQTPGYLDHGDAVQAMVGADLLFLPMHTIHGAHRATIVPGKTYEYLAAGKPILGAMPDGDAKDFVLEARAGRVVPPSDVPALAHAIDCFLDEAPVSRRPIQSVARFDRRRLTSQLAAHFRALAPESRAQRAPDPFAADQRGEG